MTQFLRVLAVFQLFLKLNCSGVKLFSLATVVLLGTDSGKKLKFLNFENKD